METTGTADPGTTELSQYRLGERPAPAVGETHTNQRD